MAEKFALVTGGSSGIGLEIAWQLAMRGYALLLISNEAARLEELKATLSQQYKVRVETLYINLANNAAAKQIHEFCTKSNFEVEVLVNNAGFFFFSEVANADVEKAEAMIQVHVLTSSLLCTYFGSDMKQRKKGYILNISSISAYKDFPGIAHYASTKAYIKSFTQSLHYELNYYGVHVTCLSPGATATNLYDPNVIDVELGKKLGIMMNAEEVARKGVNGLFNNKAVVIPGIVTKLMLFFSILTPNFIIYFIRKRTKWLK